MYPKPIQVLYQEGGVWHDWGAHIAEQKAVLDDPNDSATGKKIRFHHSFRVHAIRFSGGAIFDIVNGWRSTTTRMMPAPQVPTNTALEKDPWGEKAPPEKVNHPPHYGGDTTYETIKVIRAWGLDKNFNLGNAVKYISRAEKKGSYVEDLKKAIWYLQNEVDYNTPTETLRRDASSGDEQSGEKSESGVEQDYSATHRGFAFEKGERK